MELQRPSKSLTFAMAHFQRAPPYKHGACKARNWSRSILPMVRHVPREANLVVDRIANMVVVDMEGVNDLTIAPTDLLESLQSDKDNGPFDCTSVV
ncbi:hypothetical protein Golob_017714 [Gossypium lobatum]|uniref:Uncharacterized protein n=1 Tax=Gossypium lobatum TaxID=34289 RepID=A0A7J8M815_9ROSI|nr:hypothetical protein [Gossypium lobatum]